MAKRAEKLLGRGPDFIGRVLTHPAQLAACRVIEDLIGRLRTLETPSRELRTPGSYYEFQRLLFSQLIDMERRQAEATRNVKRERAGKSVPAAPQGSWELEQAVLDRIARQLRSVGDGLAWRVHRFDRRVVFALSRIVMWAKIRIARPITAATIPSALMEPSLIRPMSFM